MNSKRTYVYNAVLRENDVCPQGELLTDKELERMKQHNPRRDWPETKKAKVYADSCYICFGVRFGTVKQYINNMKKTVYLYVERDDSEYDCKAIGFASYTEANDYRQECQRSWMGRCDYVYLWTGSKRINLTRMPKDERNKLLKQFNIPE